MKIGVPKEIKNNEYRIGLTPASVKELVSHGHEVYVETNGGAAIGYYDDDYIKSGAEILLTAQDIFSTAELIIKVKEPQPQECKMLSQDQVLFTYLHLAPDPKQAALLQESNCIAIAYETITDKFGGLPLLAPMSEVAGRMSVQAGAYCLEKPQGGSGVLLGGVPGTQRAKVTVIGGGVVGTSAIKIALGMGSDVTVIDLSLHRLRELENIYGSNLKTLYSNRYNLEEAVIDSDLVIGAVLIPGAAAPKLVTEEMIKKMRPGSVVVDVAIDQGGCFETSHVTTHAEPTFSVDGIIHYCVANMPGACARTSTQALNNATLPYAIKLANMGYKKALLSDDHFLSGLNVFQGKITNKPVADSLKCDFVEPREALK